ncbi:TIGR03749 family integrating conjugative element protein [Dickeya oryzae]|uniref:TIGR03749 family integrating conjugative element protein n=1 Tax=Dickeya oryzae TaxID=1240404 RepID=A0ABS5BGT3_9GAMM|nr:TIGR03749 family integrating conjugative element protein [Dickeya oryzae]MBP2859389.1 TIGR03749 family integrating conjugative element protein [Dickeya oryzae]
MTVTVFSRITSALLIAAAFPVSAVELMRWERIPLQVPLNVGQERIVFVDKNVRVGFPPSLKDKLRVQSSGGAVYLSASEAFPTTRLTLLDAESGEIILLDISASAGKALREPVKVVYEGEVTSVLSPDNAKTTGSSNGNGHRASSGSVKSESADSGSGSTSRRQAPSLNAPLPVVMTRYAAQNLYAPLRAVESVPGIHPVPLRLPGTITTLYPSEPVQIKPLAAWALNEHTVVALQVRNTSTRKVILDPRRLDGRFLSAAFQHRWLGRAGTPEDTTAVYLVVQGKPDSAFIAEPVMPAQSTKKR